jgi:hypothetical protein
MAATSESALLWNGLYSPTAAFPVRAQVSECGTRSASRLAQGVVAFRATVVEPDAKFRLGQNERLDVPEDILQRPDPVTQSDLRTAMVHANLERRGGGR